ncbi:MAG: cytochrome c [Gemmatimonadota bacterium]|nr:cytochrome c [Gemmatimonadota bacterium]
MKHITFKLAGRLLAFSTIFIVVGCSGRGATDDADVGAPAARPAAPESGVTAERPASITDAMVQEGAQIYAGAGICAACHGADATGAVGPDLTDAEWLIGDGEFEQLVDQILEGVSAAEATNPLGAIMPPKGGAAITDAQVRAVAAYVWTLSH